MATDSLSAWIIAAVAAGILGVLAYLVRAAFEGVQRGLTELGGKLDSMAKAMAATDVHAAGFEGEVRGELRALRERLDRLDAEVARQSSNCNACLREGQGA
jgi:hypothetical protein